VTAPVPLLTPPQEVLEIARSLEAAGHETWCVGGAIRDSLLGLPDRDWDLATSARPADVQRIFRRTVPIGVRFGTVGVLDRSGVMYEVTTFREDVATDGRHAEVRFGASLEQDLARRDFTINAMAYSPTRDELRDPFGGRVDLAAGTVRAVGTARDRMREDHLRALRAIRFAARFGFEIEPETWRAIVESAPMLRRLSPERVRQELEKTMEQVVRPSLAIAMWVASGAMSELAPLISAGLAGSRGTESLAAIDCVPKPQGAREERRSARVKLRLALLVLPLAGANAARALRALRFSNADVEWAAELADRWSRLREPMENALMRPGGPASAEIRRWVAVAGRPGTSALLRVAEAVWSGARARGITAPTPPAVQSLYRRAILTAFRDAVRVSDLAVDGSDLLHAGVARGPALGEMLAYLLDWVLDDPFLNTFGSLMAEVRDRLADVTHSEGSD